MEASENMAPASSAPAKSNMSGEKSSIGIEPNIAALLGWLIPLLALVWIIIEKDSKFVKFHAWQALAWSFGLGIISFFGSFVFGFMSAFLPDIIAACLGLFTLIFSCLPLIGYLVNIMGAIKSYNGEMWEAPVVASFAHGQAK